MMVGHDHSLLAAMRGLNPSSRICPNGLRCLPRPFFGCAVCETNQVVFYYGLKLPTSCAGSGASWKCLQCRPRSAAAYDWSRAVGRSYKEIRGWLLPMLDLEVHERGYTANQSWPSSIQSLQLVSKRPRKPLGQPLLASCP